MSKESRDKSIAAVGSIVVHVIALLVLFLMAFRTPLPLPGEEGVEVDLGMMDQGMGNIQPEKPAIPMAAQPQQEESKNEEDIVTQNDEEAPAIEKPKNTKPKQEKPAEEPKPQVNNRALFKGSNNPQAGGSEGITGQPGDQGKPNGLAGVRQYDGDGKNGGGGNGGVSAHLGNRKTTYLPKPPSVDTDLEIIKVEIKVNRNGKVVKQWIADGYKSTTSKTNQNLALELASKTTFESDDNAPEEQSGSITYTFKY